MEAIEQALPAVVDIQEMLAGYRAGMTGQVCPSSASATFRHGWHNGWIDGGFDVSDEQPKH